MISLQEGSTQSFHHRRLIKWVPGISWNLVAKLNCHLEVRSSLEEVESHRWKRVIKSFFYFVALMTVAAEAVIEKSDLCVVKGLIYKAGCWFWVEKFSKNRMFFQQIRIGIKFNLVSIPKKQKTVCGCCLLNSQFAFSFYVLLKSIFG